MAPAPAVAAATIAAAWGYLTGSIQSADAATRLAGRRGTDLRVAGSGNPGALNAAAVLGPRWGVAVLVADMAKGAAAGAIGRLLGGPAGAYAAATSRRDAERTIWISSTAWVAAAFLWWRRQLPNAWGPPPTLGLPLFALAGSIMIVAKFRAAREPR